MFSFYKYHGAGNDFIMIPNFDGKWNDKPVVIQSLCNRRIGIGADGLILLNAPQQKGMDFEMRYFNADGYEGSMCGNGGRCAVAFANKLHLIQKETNFLGIDGTHYGKIISEHGNNMEIALQMKNVNEITTFEEGYFLNTGSPHVVTFVENVEQTDVLTEGKRIRHHPRFPEGTNVNFVEIKDNHLFVRTFERGVEDETLSCGTGVTASALAYAIENSFPTVNIRTLGGRFTVSFEKNNNTFERIFLQGPTCFVFEGKI